MVRDKSHNQKISFSRCVSLFDLSISLSLIFFLLLFLLLEDLNHFLVSASLGLVEEGVKSLFCFYVNERGINFDESFDCFFLF